MRSTSPSCTVSSRMLNTSPLPMHPHPNHLSSPMSLTGHGMIPLLVNPHCTCINAVASSPPNHLPVPHLSITSTHYRIMNSVLDHCACGLSNTVTDRRWLLHPCITQSLHQLSVFVYLCSFFTNMYGWHIMASSK